MNEFQELRVRNNLEENKIDMRNVSTFSKAVILVHIYEAQLQRFIRNHFSNKTLPTDF